MEKTTAKQSKDRVTTEKIPSDPPCKRFVLVGSESTGKTTLAQDLVHHFREMGGKFSSTMLVPEYGRDYTVEKLAKAQALAKTQNLLLPGMESLLWTEQDFINIAIKQNQLENEAGESGSPLVICDTDTFATAIWHERYLQCWSETLEKMIQDLPPRELYLLADDSDIPFEADEIRDGEHLRSWMTSRFEAELARRKFPFITLHGNRKERFDAAVESITQRL